ncbi:uncharacterized protein LOC100121915 isoform X2 [Nasonia vitripennis]|uniref:CCHC-type domain-containing protein n=1 Tax=Nasonia vitripennis TaxID=7425 RepID=A0A7M7IQU4_NASVI|nr:uncharacterized protein LOC100121915 isoform X2 [Nasonia vitripennis]
MELNKPDPFKPNKNQIGQDWKIWKKEFLIYLRLSGCYEKCTEEERALILVNLMGTEGVRAMEQMTFDEPEEKHDMDILIKKFDQIFDPPLNEAEERYKFFSRRIRANENIDNYVADLKTRASTCNFGSQSENFIIDMIIRDMDSYIRDVVFALGEVTIFEVIQYYKQFNINNDKIKELTKKAIASKPETSEDTDSSNKAQDKSNQPKFCWKCNSRHVYGSCPAYGNICNYCNQKNHFNGVCQKQDKNNKKEETKQVCSKCGTNHPYKQCPAYDKICGKCSMKGHYTQQCKEKKNDNAVDNKEEIKRICSRCGTNHPYGQCPANDKICGKCSTKGHYTQLCKEEIKRICSRCGTNHLYGQCPANDKICGKCSMKGHYTQQCKGRKNDDEVNRNTNTAKSTDDKAQKLSDDKLEDCSWCELKHLKDLCPHPACCIRCEAFPHNICPKCKKNPHDLNCHYKTVITLPSKTPVSNKSDMQNCTNCGTYHRDTPCNPFILYCNKCKSHDHATYNCVSSQRQNNNTAQSSTSDPLLKDYVKVENVQRPSSSSANYQRTTSTSSTSNTNYPNNVNYHKPTPSSSAGLYQRTTSTSSTSNTNYPNNVNYHKPTPSSSTFNTNFSNNTNHQKPMPPQSDFKKQNKKPDACTIS